MKFIASSQVTDLPHGKYLETFAKLWTKHRSEIRSFIVYLGPKDMVSGALVEYVYFYLSQSLRDKAGAPSEGLVLGGGGCSEEAFKTFVEAATKTLALDVIPPPGSSWELERFRARWSETHVDEELVRNISGAVAAGQFDTALKAAIGVVESRLRQRCVAAGQSIAASQAGADLAVTAYHKDKGCLTPPWPIATEACSGAQLYFQGFFLYLRNAYMHHATVMGSDLSAVYDALATCEFMLKVIDKSTNR